MELQSQVQVKPRQQKQNTSVSDEVAYAFFILDGHEFGIDVEFVRETINADLKLTHIPCSMDALDGLINLRGSIIPIVNLRTRFKIPPSVSNTEKKIAITLFNGHLFGLRFDEISEVARFQKSEIKQIDTSEHDPDLCSLGVVSLDDGERIIQLLDLDRLFHKYQLPHVENSLAETRARFQPKKQDITFSLDNQEYSIDVHAIQEIIKPPKIRRKILVDPAIKGVIDLRGGIISIVDLRVCFELPEKEISPDSRIIILRNQRDVGILVDRVKAVIHYEESQVLPIPIFATEQKNYAGIIDCGEEHHLIKLDPDHLFTRELLTQLSGNKELHLDECDDVRNDEISATGMVESIKDLVLISFRLEEEYGFDIELFREIINYPADGIVRLPGLESYHEGVLNLRNSAIPVINLRRYYGMDDFPDVKESKIIILNSHGNVIGMMVDEIIEIVRFSRMKVDRLPSIAAEGRGQRGGHHVQEAYRLQTPEGIEKELLIYDVEGLMNDLHVSLVETVDEILAE